VIEKEKKTKLNNYTIQQYTSCSFRFEFDSPEIIILLLCAITAHQRRWQFIVITVVVMLLRALKQAMQPRQLFHIHQVNKINSVFYLMATV